VCSNLLTSLLNDLITKYKIMEFNLFIGTDVSKKTLDFAVVENADVKLTYVSENSIKGIKEFFKAVGEEYELDLSKVVFCMEYTGIYNNHLLSYLHSIKANIWLGNPIHIKRSLGLVRGKNDKIDAKRIAMFAFKNRDEVQLWEPERKVIQELKALTGIRNRIIKSMESLTVPLNEVKSFVDKKTIALMKVSCKSSINALKKDLKGINRKILEVIKSDEKLNHLFKIVTSVENVGPVVATAVIIETNEFQKINEAKKFACFAGVAPFKYDSGTSVKSKARVSNMAKKPIKTLLHMAALGSVSRPGEMRNYFERKISEGKNKMLILNAIRNKIVLRIFACVRKDSLFVKC
jgi:transposase